MTPAQQLLADDPIRLILLKVVALFALGVVMTLFMINWEREVFDIVGAVVGLVCVAVGE